jgi:hypothetical protein
MLLIDLAPRPGLEPGTCGLGIRSLMRHEFGRRASTLSSTHALPFVRDSSDNLGF